MKYVIKKKLKSYKITEIDSVIKGFKIDPKNDEVKSITFVNENITNIVLSSKINNIFTRLLMIVNDAFNSDDNPSGIAIALDEIAMVKSSIRNKYAKYLKKEKEELYLKKLALIEEEMQVKMMQLQDSYYQEETKGKGR